MMASIAESVVNFIFAAFNLTQLLFTCILLQLKAPITCLPVSLLEAIFMCKEIPSLNVLQDCSHHLLALVEASSPRALCFSPCFSRTPWSQEQGVFNLHTFTFQTRAGRPSKRKKKFSSFKIHAIQQQHPLITAI